MVGSSSKKIDDYGFLFVSISIILITILVFNNFVIQRGPMRWDESEHVLTALIFANDMHGLDIVSLASHCYEQLLWPFVNPMLLSMFFLSFVPSIIAARTFSLIFYALFVLSLYFLGREIVEKDKAISGMICSFFGIVTGAMYLYASEAMLEMVALLFFTLTCIFFIKSKKQRNLLFLVPFFGILTFFSKTNFGVVLFLSILIWYILRYKFSVRKIIHDRSFLLTFIPIILVLGLWLLIPPERLITFLGFLVNRPEGPNPFSIEGIMLYPELLYDLTGPLILLHIAAFALSLKYMKNEKIRFFVVLILITFILNFFHQNKKIRFILYMYPALFALTSFHLTSLFSKIKKANKEYYFALVMFALLVSFSLYMYQNVRLYDDYYSVDLPLEFIKNNTQGASSVFLIGEFNELSPALITWHLSNLTHIKDVGAITYSVYQFENLSGVLDVPDGENIDKKSFNSFITKEKFENMVLITVYNKSVFYDTEDYIGYNKWKLSYIPIALDNANYSVVAERNFSDISVGITILGLHTL